MERRGVEAVRLRGGLEGLLAGRFLQRFVSSSCRLLAGWTGSTALRGAGPRSAGLVAPSPT